MMYGYDVSAQDWLLMLAMMGVMTVLTVVAVVAIVRGVRSSKDAADRGREVLDERYARGELTTEEYRERVHELSRR
jgi:putative membrane protein